MILEAADAERFVRTHAALGRLPLVPEIELFLASEVVPLWRATETELATNGVPPPYWAFAWAGGQALARHVLDHPEFVRGKTVLDFGAGSGLVALAAVKAGAAHVTAAEIDPFARAAIRLNAEANGLDLETTGDEVIGGEGAWEVILAGDMCYERPLAERLIAWLGGRVWAGAAVLLGDPGRSYFPSQGVEKCASYSIVTTRELEDSEMLETGVYRFLGEKAG